MAETPATTLSDVRMARSLLFVPGHLAGRFAKASASGADAVICDLEDAVPPELKALARRHVVDWLTGSGAACVRINSLDDPAHVDDLVALRGLPGLRAVLVPKAEDPAGLEEVNAALGGETSVIALVESALGIHRASALAGARGVTRLAFGSIDFALDAGVADDDQAMLFARSTLVIASRVNRIAAPIDGVTTEISDVDVARAAARRAKDLGFGGKLCIHPSQVVPVNGGFAPSKEELTWARRALDRADDSGGFRADGHAGDKPVIERARAILAKGTAADPGRG
jgi:citrate lyase subunit beta / citryl-CoA lyase